MNQIKNWNDQVSLGQIKLKNRIVLAALTRQRCDIQTCIPTPVMTEYYCQRSGAGLMLTQCVAWTQRGQSFPGAANLYTRQQMQGWRQVVQQVHKRGATIFVQIFHGGRSCLTQTTKGLKPQAPSALRIRDMHFFLQKQHQIPTEMTLEDIEFTKQQFRKSVKLAKQAGFDGVQLHGAHGYLIDQFLKSWSNKRTDKYGGSAQNRCRFALQLTDIALQHFIPYQVGIKISPCSRYNDQYDDNPAQTYTYLARQLNKKNIGFIQIRESIQPVASSQQFPTQPQQQIQNICKLIRPQFTGLIIGNEQMTSISGIQKINKGECDLISFGRDYVCNPDLAQRIINNKQISKTFDWVLAFRGTKGQSLQGKGYTDYPTYEQIQKQKLLNQSQVKPNL